VRGEPAQALRSSAIEYGADLVVVGSGSKADRHEGVNARLVMSATVPTLVLPPEAELDWGLGANGWAIAA
jgi:nucleotide-binding universal stress UspA family protein